MVIDQTGYVFAAERCAIALKNAVPTAAAIPQPAPLYTANAAMV